MKITETSSSVDLYINQAKEQKKFDINSQNKTNQPVASEDTVKLSSAAKEISLARKVLDLSPEIRDEKVAEARRRIANGTYKIDGNKIGLNMLKESLLNELL
jgi:negative regulator of flagellin synthesis FlgM